MTKAKPEQIKELANTVAQQAEALATGNHTATAHALSLLIAGNVATLVEWTKEESA